MRIRQTKMLVLTMAALAASLHATQAKAVIYAYKSPIFTVTAVFPGGAVEQEVQALLQLKVEDYLPDGTTIFDASNLQYYHLNVGAYSFGHVGTQGMDFGALQIENGQVTGWTLLFNEQFTSGDFASSFWGEMLTGSDEFGYNAGRYQDGEFMLLSGFSGRSVGLGTWTVQAVPEPVTYGMALAGLIVVVGASGTVRRREVRP